MTTPVRPNAVSPLKRPREIRVPPFDVNNLLADVHQALTTKQRLAVFSRIRQLVIKDNTVDPKMVAWLLDAGILPALVLQLNFVLHRHGSTTQEVGQLLSVLDLLIRHCEDKASVLEELGNSFLTLIGEVLNENLHWGTPVAAVSLLHVLSGTSQGTLLMLQNKSLLYRIVELLQQHHHNREILLETLGLLKNLTYYADEERKVLVHLPGFMSALTTLPHSACIHEKALERMSAILRNLSLSANIRTLLAQQPEFIHALYHLAKHENLYVHQNFLNTLISLSMEAESCLLLVFYGDGQLLKVLQQLLTHDDATVRKRAARTLRLWASNDLSGPLLVHDSTLMNLLSKVALQDDSHDVRSEAAEAFAKCASLVQSHMPQHDAVLDALSHLAQSPTTPAQVLARALKAQANHPPNRRPMAQRTVLLETLARIALQDSTTMAQEDACCALVDLATEQENREVLATCSVLEALVRNTVGRLQRRDYAVQALMHLATEPANRTKMVNHPNLLPSLIQYAGSAQEGETKDNVKKIILLLVSEL